MEQFDGSLLDENILREWVGRWIGPANDDEVNSRSLFRRGFTVEETSGHRLFISAERDYQLYVNGQFICRGVPPSPFYYKFYDTVDLSEHLRKGQNCIAVLVSQIGAPRIGLVAELVNGNDNVIMATDESWRVRSRTGWSIPEGADVENTHFQEIFDARLHPTGWTDPDFDDGDWNTPRLYPPIGQRGCPWKRMVERRTPHPAEWEVLPKAVTAVREGKDILSRGPVDHLSAVLSAPGREPQHARIENRDNLLMENGSTILQRSTNHHDDPAFDGIYAPSIVLDFGKVITGYLTIELEGTNGGQLDIGYAERLLDGEFNNAIEVPYADRYMMKEGTQRFESTIWKGFRYVKLRLSGTEEPVSIRSVRVRNCTYPYEKRGDFEADDERLNEIFDICRYTIRLCSRDFLMDTPWRERNQWLGDNSAVTLPGIYSCFGDTALPRQFLKQAAATPLPNGLLVNNSQTQDALSYPLANGLGNPIPDYSLYWIQGILDYYRFTGDAEMVRSVYPHVVNILQYHFRHLNEYGLVSDLPVWVFIDHVFHPPCGTLTAYNAIWHGTLKNAAELADICGDAETRKKAEACREAVKNNFTEAFYDADVECFRDGFADGGPTGGISEHSNLAAIRWDLATESQTASILQHFYEEEDIEYLEAEPFFCHVVLAGLRRAGRMDLALQLIRDRWGRRMVDQGMTSTTEEWHASGSWRGADNQFVGMFRSLSHAWSACPAEFLVRQLTGFEILEPGCKRVHLDPARTEFNYTVTIPTPRGDIGLQWQDKQVGINAPQKIEVDCETG